jgi:hypothetical protein
MLFTADVGKYPGTNGNAISIAVARAAAPAGDPVTVTVAGTTINVVLNTHPGKQPTPVQLRDAINAGAFDDDGDRMLTAQIILPDATKVTGSMPLNLNLRLAEVYDFGSDGLAALRFRAVDFAVPSGLVTIAVSEAALGTGGDPSITVNGSRIDVVLDSTTPTTAGQLLAGWAAVPAASALVLPQLVFGAPTASIVGGGARTITLDVRNRFTQRNALDQFRSLTLADADQALVMSSFGAVNPLQIRLAAVATGAAGNGIKVQVVSRPLGAGAGPTVTISGQSVNIELNSTAGSETTVQQLIDALRTNAGSLLDVTLLYGDPNEALGGRPNTFSPLVLLGGDDAQVVPGYIGLPGDDPATPNDDPDEASRINRNEIIVRFAEVLPDDFYRIELFAQNDVVSGGTALLDRAGNALQPANPNADREVMDFELELGAQVVSVVPQPVTRNVQRVLTPAIGANITLTFIDQSLTVPDNLTAAQLQTALETGLTNLMPGDVVVTGPTAGDWTIAFHGRYNEQRHPAAGWLVRASRSSG